MFVHVCVGGGGGGRVIHPPTSFIYLSFAWSLVPFKKTERTCVHLCEKGLSNKKMLRVLLVSSFEI